MSSEKLRYMICIHCKLDKDTKDYIMGNVICYKCVFEAKIKIIGKRKPFNLKCKICNAYIKEEKENKNRQKEKYCSVECAKIGHKININNYWARSI
jgi:hypothetical protein